MHEVVGILGANGIWIMIIAVVGLTGWFRFQEKELRSREQMRVQEMEHLERMKKLEIELAKTRQQTGSGNAA